MINNDRNAELFPFEGVSMLTLPFLVVFPALVAALLLLISRDSRRRLVVWAGAAVTGIASLSLLFITPESGPLFYPVGYEVLSEGMFVAELAIAVFLIYLGIKYRKYLAIFLILFQAALLVFFETGRGSVVHHIMPDLFIDQFSLIMALIIGIIGSLICVYSLGYMATYHERHPNVPDRRRSFFFLVFIFLSAMFGLVFSDYLPWIFFFWEITTLCSFLLIGYSKTDESIKNAFLALNMNILGGIAFAGALLYIIAVNPGGDLLHLHSLIQSGHAIALVPAVLIGFAGITKSALMPFSGWLVGAMVAPTPVSALLHSSTMVKAGVYIIVRFAPVLTGTMEGLIIGLVGGVTFLLASAIAISQSNAKKVLAYSTIANLGLIVACAGVGTYKLIWAAILLIIFHAIAKSLLFLCVGTVEHRIGSRDIEDMTGLIVRMPRISVMMFIGIAGMFLAPFGMLISKWAAIEAFIDAQFGLAFVAILAFGGSLTVLFWSKWMGKIISMCPVAERVENNIPTEKWMVLSILTALTVLVCLIFPIISAHLIEPFVLAVYGQTTRLSQDNITIMAMMLFLLMIMPFSLLLYRNDKRIVPAYMGGRPATADLTFQGSLGMKQHVGLCNYYFEEVFGEQKLFMAGSALCFGLILLVGTLTAGVAL
ncbi:MAG: proton-conducting transporter membrane subunit [Methanolinea sp.]|nr:proton-conducting transporter membrane subunit [Methanolinea sp.]